MYLKITKNVQQNAFIKLFISIFIGNMVRRTSSSRMYHTLSVEAPITKVMHILMSARESSPLYIAQALDKVHSTLNKNLIKNKSLCMGPL